MKHSSLYIKEFRKRELDNGILDEIEAKRLDRNNEKIAGNFFNDLVGGRVGKPC